MSLLIVAIPKTHILVVVVEIISALTVLLVLKPFAFIFLTIGKCVDSVAMALAFHEVAFV